ncbi:amino acid adenylation domain-containing protein [Pseudoalteromonas sp. JC28]|uniref:non-ribosomal peptide synthetase n=1 Tax=Pseudoalteromonas sp. JC28 TaxID=2267617 RepID=UPI001571E5D9|nr:non-ribosomal peptide synthetase [Pseudoalteromonas sp. JC28]NSY32057.1 amino acid adenylation domain-containing protein [Pseudoalteromonas sp. JC28]
MNSQSNSANFKSLTTRQLHVWQAQQLDLANPVYNIACAVQFTGGLTAEALEQALVLLFARHPVLSSRIDEAQGEPQLELLACAPKLLAVPDEIAAFSDSVTAKTLIEQAIDITKETFQFYACSSETRLLLTIKGHHINCDQWALQVLMSDLLACVEAVLDNSELDLAPLDYQVMFEEKPERAATSQQSELYPIDFYQSNTEALAHHYDGIAFREENPEALKQVKQVASQAGVTSFSVVLASVFLTLFHTTGQTDLTIGIPMARRTRKTRAILGHYSDVETVSICDIEQYTGASLISEVSNQLTQLLLSGNNNKDAAKHINVTCNYLAKLKSNGIRPGITPLMIGRQGYELALGTAGDTIIKGVSIEPGVSQFDIEFTHFETEGGLCRKVVAAKSVFSRVAMTRITDIQARFIELLTHSSDLNIAELPVLDEEEQKLILARSNQDNETFFSDTTLNHWFEQAVSKHPDQIALQTQTQSIDYKTLNARANALALHLREQYQSQYQRTLTADTLIALYMQPSIEMLIAILAVTKAGAAYVPLSPDHASERTTFILSDTNPSLLIVDEQEYAAAQEKCRLAEVACPLVTPLNAQQQSDTAPVIHQSPQDLVYIIYTSGTTGQPKGVMQTHENVARLFTATEQDYGFDHHDTWVLYHAYTFDFSVWEMWGALLYGGKLCIPDNSLIRDFEAFADYCSDNQVTVLNQTPAAFYEFSAAALSAKLNFDKLRYVIFGGDKLNPEMLNPWWNRYGDEQPLLVNMYGITETTVHVTFKALTQQSSSKASHIGRPILDMKAYVLNSKLQLVEPGACGELYIGGAGLARGYLNRQALSQERFISSPYASEQDIQQGRARLYKTGDLARRLPDGELEYIGRNDNQVKIRGYRIELGEIESVINQLPEVAQAVVIDRTLQSVPYLAAYIKFKPQHHGQTAQVKAHVSQALPSYMQPKTWTELAEIPLTGNGKLDRKALPEPELVSQSEYVAPQDETEAQLCEAFKTLLGVEQVSTKDDFFAIGGDSILTIQLVALLRKQGIELQVKDIFDCPTAAALSQRIVSVQATQREIAQEQGLLSGRFDLLPIQQWFFNKALPEENHWNQAFAIRIPSGFSQIQLQEALHSLSDQHDMLRTTFMEFEGHITQEYNDVSTMAPLNVLNGKSHDVQAELNARQSQFDICNGPLWQVTHIEAFCEDYDLLHFALHHLIIDAVSWRIIAQDLQTLLAQGELLSKRTSYRQWVEMMQAYPAAHPQEMAFWQRLATNLPSYPPSMAATPSTAWLELDAHTTARFIRDANAGFNTQGEELLLAALCQALSKTFKQTQHAITLESHGREMWRDDADINQTIGWFTCLYPLRLTQQATLSDTIIDAKEALRQIPNKGLGFGSAQLQDTSLTLPSISFNYLGQMGGQSDALWQIDNQLQTETSSAQNGSDLILDINALVQGEQLRIKVDSLLDGNLTDAFATHLTQALHDVLDTALEAKKRGGVCTPSDFGAGSLSQEQLAALQSQLSETQLEQTTTQSEKTQELEI